MKVKLFLIVFSLTLLSGLASAQGYVIRISANTNLRAAASLQASIVETATAGATLTVIGSYNRWLRINHNGEDVWMADWVRHERVEEMQETTQTQTQTTTNIDNCCFVDRLCMSDAEWVSGYWTFQNGQCAAPTQTQTQTSTQTTSRVSSQVDNCCFVDRQCATDQEWTDGYWAFQNNQCGSRLCKLRPRRRPQRSPRAVDPGQGDNCCFLGWQCNSDEDWSAGFYAFQSRINAGIPAYPWKDRLALSCRWSKRLICCKARVPHWYDYTIRGLDKIRQVLPPTPCCVGVSVQGKDIFYRLYRCSSGWIQF